MQINLSLLPMPSSLNSQRYPLLNILYSVVLPYPWGICSRNSRRCLKLWIVPNPVIHTYFRDIMSSVPDHCNKASHNLLAGGGFCL